MNDTTPEPVRHPDLAPLPPLVDRMITPTEVARALKIDRGRASRLVASGALGPVYDTGGRLNRYVVDAELTHKIESEGRVGREDLPSGVLVKVGAAELEDDPDAQRAWRGFDALMSDEDKRRALAFWWPIADPEGFVGQHLFVTMHQVIVEVYRIVGAHPDVHPVTGRIGFTTEPAEPDIREKWIGRRVATRPGSLWDTTGSNAAA